MTTVVVVDDEPHIVDARGQGGVGDRRRTAGDPGQEPGSPASEAGAVPYGTVPTRSTLGAFADVLRGVCVAFTRS